MSKEIINISKKNYGKNLKANREESGLTQQQLAERLKIPRTEITMIENGKRFPKIERHKEIINALELDFETDLPYFEDDVSDLTKQLHQQKSENIQLKQQLEVAEKMIEYMADALIVSINEKKFSIDNVDKTISYFKQQALEQMQKVGE